MAYKLYEGSVLKNIGIFSVPYLIAYFLQTLYGMADLFIVGQFTDAAGITAVSVGSQFMHFLTVLIVGLAMGTTVLVGRAVGAKKISEISHIVGNTAMFFMGVSVVLMVALLALTSNVVGLLKTPLEAVGGTHAYLVVCFWGMPFITAYNVIASIFRGLGDSKSPMYFAAVACVLNVALDYLFIGAFSMGATGAAIATVIAQAFSVAISAVAMRRSLKRKNSAFEGVCFSRNDFRLDKNTLKSILKIGLPVSAQDGFIQVSFLFITIIANMRGVEIAAAVGIVEKIICFLFLVPSSMLSTVSAIGAQNIGAGRYDRALETFKWGTLIATSAGFVFAVLFQFISEPTLALFTNDSTVVHFGTQYLRIYVVDCVFAAVHFCYSGFFVACGMSVYSFIHNSLSIVLMRVPGAYIASIMWPETLVPMGAATPLGSLLSIFICFYFYSRMRKKISAHL